ncbi:single-stranded DNA-binding protein [Pseudarthrobacter albicanus]|uniref:single-stranded DNA-binding protein n=1 Tax=Pseudarthrobacter albicanus TaxID=2823873 RepID=UPI001BA5258C|nr:single-stranded DNA-binding protein [Pseudarthrobacter albicanus]
MHTRDVGEPTTVATSGGTHANYTIASTPRTFDRKANDWVDGETLFLRASVWREAAEHVAESLTKGTRVIATGLLTSRTYETKTGETRTVIELEVEEIGPSLRYAAEDVHQTRGGRPDAAQSGAGQEQPHPAESMSISSREYADDDPWFGIDANPGGRIPVPGAATEPAI